LDRHPHEEWQIGDWRVSPELGQISRMGETKKLDPRAMRLLMFLAERPGQIVGISDLLDGVWAKAVVTPNSVYEAIAALRQALGDSSDRPEYVITLPRRGYRLIAPVVPPQRLSEQPVTEAIPAVDTAPMGPSRIAPSRRRAKWVWLGAAIGLAAILTMTWFTRAARTPDAAVSGDKSIAVLPFVDLSEKKDQEYLADGLAEELLDVLANLPTLRVIGRTSSFQFKNRNVDVRSIGAQLGAAYLVEGSVRRVEAHVRVAAQLIRTSDGTHQWSGSFDRHVGDILQVESELAAALGRALQLSVTSSAASNRIKTNDSEANDHYLQGLHALDTHSRAQTEEAANQFQAAIALDPKFAAAHVSLAMTYYVQATFGFDLPDTGFPRMREEALSALQLNPQSAVAHALLARMATLYSWDWPEAKRESDTALRLGSQNSFALYASADLAAVLGDFDRSEQLFRASFVSDPLNPETHCMLATVMQGAELNAAEAEVRRCLTIAPGYSSGHALLAYILILQGRGNEAIDECRLETESGSSICLASVYHANGREKDSEAALDQAIRARPATSPYSIAGVFAYRAQNDLSFEWLDRAYRERDPSLVYIKGDPNFENLRRDSRYKALLQKMNLPD
jgi:TolB-like protein/DNA-binding winged helix-turn-helix (wHTH) protein